MKKKMTSINVLVLVVILLTGCNFSTDGATPTVEVTIEQVTASQEATATSVLSSQTQSPLPQPTEIVNISTPSATATPLPSPMPSSTSTPGPWEYTIQDGDSLGYIIQQSPFNYRTYDVMGEIVRLNDNVPSADRLPAVGSVILIPRQTATPIPLGVEETAAMAEVRDEHPEIRGLPSNTQFGCHIVASGETIVGIVEQYATTLEILSQLNGDIDFGGCNFENPGGGPNCNPLISEGQCVQIPLPTPTPTPSPTPSGNETATFTPTYPVPNTTFPPEGGIVPPAMITLQWVSVGVLEPDQYYLVQVMDITAGTQPWANVTSNTSMQLPDTLIPADGQAHIIEWSVMIASQNEQGLFEPIGGTGNTRTFQWQSR
jgi:hypothetical protein